MRGRSRCLSQDASGEPWCCKSGYHGSSAPGKPNSCLWAGMANKKVIPTSGKVLFLLCQRNRYDLPPFAEYMETISFCEIWPNLRPQMEQNCSCCSITFRVKMFMVTSASIPHSVLCSHPSWGSIKVCTSFFVTRGGWERTQVPFLFQRSSSAAELGAECLLMSLFTDVSAAWHHPVGAIG